jgi:hypothetical protein
MEDLVVFFLEPVRRILVLLFLVFDRLFELVALLDRGFQFRPEFGDLLL